VANRSFSPFAGSQASPCALSGQLDGRLCFPVPILNPEVGLLFSEPKTLPTSIRNAAEQENADQAVSRFSQNHAPPGPAWPANEVGPER